METLYFVVIFRSIRSRDREIAPTEEPSAVSGQKNSNQPSAVSGIRCRDREIAPTEPQITFGLAFFRLR